MVRPKTYAHLCCEPLNTLCLCLSFLVRSRILIGKILRLSKMLVPDGTCDPKMSIFSLSSCRGAIVYELPCRVGENTKKLLPAYSPSVSLVLGIF